MSEIEEKICKYKYQKKLRKRAHLKLFKAVRSKKIIPGPCEICGTKKVDGHHEDYNRPYDVKWLCRSCHLALHRYKNDPLNVYYKVDK